MRTLYVGLGGTGGEVLSRLYKMMTPEQRKESKYLYLDLDIAGTDKRTREGVKTVRISTDDTVGEMITSLGRESGVMDWIPTDQAFLASTFDDGAGEIRFKSRLCFARFFSNSSNELAKELKELSVAGLETQTVVLRVVIVASVAGGTGSGSFINTALYIRKFFRELHQEVQICGLFACPDIFVNANAQASPEAASAKEEKKQNMFSNAYAVVRELNAMTLAVGGKGTVSNDYGSSIRIKIDSKGEGKLFDSQDKQMTSSYKSKPFDVLYFIDESNREGGIFLQLEDYYQIMADIAYTRLYSWMRYEIQSKESNELPGRIEMPTSIFGSAGFAKIVYPYQDILNYTAKRKLLDELTGMWTQPELDWIRYSNEKRRDAVLAGRTWIPKSRERAAAFFKVIDGRIKDSNSSMYSIRKSIYSTDEQNKARKYLDRVKDEIRSKCGIAKKDGTTEDGTFGLGSLSSVSEARSILSLNYNGKALSEAKSSFERLRGISHSMEAALPGYIDTLLSEVPDQAVMLANVILPMYSTVGEDEPDKYKTVNIRTGLLMNEDKDVHPIAARYLLYQLRDEIKKELPSEYVSGDTSAVFEKNLKRYNRILRLAFDSNLMDANDRTMADVFEELEKKRGKAQEKEAAEKLALYKEKCAEILRILMDEATRELYYLALQKVQPRLDTLISEYENFFSGIEEYREALEREIKADEFKHELDDTRYLYVGATARMKRGYYINVKEKVGAGNTPITAVTGKTIFESLHKSTIARRRREEEVLLIGGVQKPQENDYKDEIHRVFEDVIEKYEALIEGEEKSLKMSVVEAIVRECRDKVESNEYSVEYEGTNVFENELKTMFKDLLAKAQPMIRYNKNHVDSEYGGRDVSEVHNYLAIGTQSKKDMLLIFPEARNEDDALLQFQRLLSLENTPANGKEYNDCEITCCSTVHSLQAMQIDKFNEESLLESAYYPYYKRKIESVLRTGRLSLSPHLDKKWHLRGVMPYISRKLEMIWRERMMKAFLAVVLTRRITFMITEDGQRSFVISTDDGPRFMKWPANELIHMRYISRLLEYLSEDEVKLEQWAEDMDKLVKSQRTKLLNYETTLDSYKGGMTSNELLQRLRNDMITSSTYVSTAKAARGEAAGKKKTTSAKEDGLKKLMEAVSGSEAGLENFPKDRDATLGGVLEVAWLIHESEERLGEDRDYGEALLACAKTVIDSFCTGYFGESRITDKESTHYRNYVELYNYTMQKFVIDYVVSVLRRRKLNKTQLNFTKKQVDTLSQEISDTVGGYPRVKVPDEIRDTDAFQWISKNWQLLSFNDDYVVY